MAVVREDVVQIKFDVEGMSELNKLTEGMDEIKKCAEGVGGDAFDEMIKESKKASEGVDDVKKSIKGIKPDGIDDTAEGLKDTDKNGEKANDELRKMSRTSFDNTVSGLKKVTGALGGAAKAAGKILVKGLVAGMAGVGALVGQAVMGFADYEQLVGGVDTLFKDSSGAVQKAAQNAYKTAGLSANDYMSTVTSFSASLIQSLGGDTAKAAKYADMAIVDMADNANKMGTDMESIQTAYQGFAKQNYTMLDNLKLGYGGTKEEMQRLLKDASAISGVKYDISSYADVVQAIHVIQEQMGIAGTTSKEASETISGSFASMKSAWANTLTSLILGGEDFDRCVDNLIDSAKTFGKNIMPAILKALEGVGALIEEMAPIIEAELPTIIDTLLPPLIKAATSLIKGLIVALPSIIGTIAKEIPEVLSQVMEAIGEAFGEIPGFGKIENFFGKLKSFFSKNAGTIKKLIPVIIGLVGAFKLFNKLKFLGGLFGGNAAGGGGGGIFSGFQSLSKLKPTTVLKGIANIAIIVGGLTLLAAALMAAAPYLAKLSDMKSVGEVLLVITAVGLIGTYMANLAGKVGNIPVATVAKGLANIAIALVGMGALAAVLMWVSPYMAELSDLKTTMEILIIIGAVGLVGSALAGLAGLIGAIPVVAVLSGLLNIALALAGFTLIVAAFGALSKIEGFNDFLTSGGETLATLCNIVGQMAGSLIGGFGEGLSDSLPAIGENLSAFATSIQPMFDTFATVDTTGLASFATAFAAFIAVIAGEQILSIFTGGIDYAQLGTDLTTFATNVSGFFSTISTFDDAAFTKATALFSCLAGISSMPKEGGVVGWFQGEVDYSKMATGLNQLATTTTFFSAVEGISETAFTNAGKLFECLAGVKGLPTEGGIKSWFTGDIAFDSVASGLQSLTSAEMIAAFTAISGLPETAFTGITSLFSALASVSAMPKEGGVASWFTGDSTTGLTSVASQLPGVATHIATFFSNLGGITDFSPIKSLFDTLSSIEINSDVADKGFLSLGSSQLETMGTGLSSFATNAATFFTKINELNMDNMSGFFDKLATAGDLPEDLASLDESIGTALSGMITTVEQSMVDMKAATTTGLKGIAQAVRSQESALYTSGVAMMQGLNNGLKSMRGRLIETARIIAEKIKEQMRKAFDINSPSRVTFEIGQFVGEGLVEGIRNSIPSVQLATKDMSVAAMPYTGGYTPDSASTTYNNGGNSETTNVSPVFNLTISGTQDDRALARKVKRFVAEAIQETFASLERKTPVLEG